MPKLPKGKVQLLAYIDENLYKELRQLIKMKHEELRGALSKEVEDALRAWIAAHRSAHAQSAQISRVNPAPRIARAWEQVREYLRSAYGYEAVITGSQIPKKLLINAIAAVRGSDPRTIRKWLSLFEHFKLIKWIAPNVVEVI